MKLRSLMIVAICALGGSHVYAQSFEKMIETVGLTLKPSMHSFQNAMNGSRKNMPAGASVHPDGSRPICVGDRVLDSDYGPGTVREVFSNRTAIILFDNFSGDRYRDFASLAKGIGCYKGLCKNNRVVDLHYGTGRVVEVFMNGVAKIDFDSLNGFEYPKIIDLGIGVDCFSGLCVGNRVFDSHFGPGRTVEVFTNGTAKIAFDNLSGYEYRNIGSLGVGTRCKDGGGCSGS